MEDPRNGDMRSPIQGVVAENPIVSAADLPERLYVVAVSGGFDPFHVGHLRYLEEAARLGRWLVVIVNGDEFLLRKKGYCLMPLQDRVAIVGALRMVDRVVEAIDEDQTVCRTLEMVHPDIFVNGGDRRSEEDIPEAETCRRLGIRLVTGAGPKVSSSQAFVLDAARCLRDKGVI